MAPVETQDSRRYISEYEKIREANIARNKALLRELGLENMEPFQKKTKEQPTKPKTIDIDPLAERRVTR